MTQKKLPRDFVGLVFYVSGWVIGAALKAIFYGVRFVATLFYTAFKRDQFNRRLRLVAYKVESDQQRQIRDYGREEIRFLAAGLGLTHARWHQSVKLRRRMFEALKRTAEVAVEKGDLSRAEAVAWTDDVSRLLFSNFNRDLLTVENKKRKKRVYKLSKSNFQDEAASRLCDTALTINSEVEGKFRPADQLETGLSQHKNFHESSGLRQENRNLNVVNLPTLPANEWASDEEASVPDNH